jgi:hypothetical protein
MTMKTITEDLDELAGLLCANRPGRGRPEKLVERLRAVMGKMSLSENALSSGFYDADYILTRQLCEYEQSPDPEGIGKIRNALVSFRTAAQM